MKNIDATTHANDNTLAKATSKWTQTRSVAKG